VELRHLFSFCAVARELHVTRAAKRLHIAQPALTQQIKHLESELAASLVRRTCRGIALTEAGAFSTERPNSDLTQHLLASESMLLAVPVSHPLARRRTIPLKSLKGKPIIVASHGAVARPFENTLDEACRKEGFWPRLVQMCPEYILALNLVAAGVGLTFVPKYMANARSDALRSLLVHSKVPLAVELCVVTRANDPSPLVSNLKNVADEHFRKRQANRTL